MHIGYLFFVFVVIHFHGEVPLPVLFVAHMIKGNNARSEIYVCVSVCVCVRERERERERDMRMINSITLSIFLR
jgi:hypothetical protein